MTNVEVFPSDRQKEPYAILAWVLSAAILALCLWASHWQYERGVLRHQRNAVISANVDLPLISLESVKVNLTGAEWRKIEVTGKFDPGHQILLRNKYFEGKYGFELLTRFTTRDSLSFWVDRGWISPGATATAQPLLPDTTTENIEMKGRLRLDSSLPKGSFFAIPNGNGKLIEKWNAQSPSNLQTATFYIDLLEASAKEMNPVAPVQLPELTDGPHMAYALQWLFFGGLAIYGRILLRRSR